MTERTAIFYNDLPDSVSKIVGEVLNEDKNFIILKTADRIVQIPIRLIVRIESEKDGRMETGKSQKN